MSSGTCVEFPLYVHVQWICGTYRHGGCSNQCLVTLFLLFLVFLVFSVFALSFYLFGSFTLPAFCYFVPYLLAEIALASIAARLGSLVRALVLVTLLALALML